MYSGVATRGERGGSLNVAGWLWLAARTRAPTISKSCRARPTGGDDKQPKHKHAHAHASARARHAGRQHFRTTRVPHVRFMPSRVLYASRTRIGRDVRRRPARFHCLYFNWMRYGCCFCLVSRSACARARSQFVCV